MGIFFAGLMPSNHTRSYLLKEKFIVKCQASDDLPWACSWVLEFGQCKKIAIIPSNALISELLLLAVRGLYKRCKYGKVGLHQSI